MILEGFEQLTKDQRESFKTIANKLLTFSYLAKEKKDNKDDYYFVINFKNYFDEYFQILGHELIINRDMGAIQLLNNNFQSIYKMKKEETFVLLILRILYQEGLIDTTLNDNVLITIDQIHDKYDMLGFKKKIMKTELINSLRLFKRMNLIENIGDITQSSTKLIIFSTITLAAPASNIVEVYNYIQALNREVID